jgi:hypothetical protein
MSHQRDLGQFAGSELGRGAKKDRPPEVIARSNFTIVGSLPKDAIARARARIARIYAPFDFLFEVLFIRDSPDCLQE